jgi:hypothetical protein
MEQLEQPAAEKAKEAQTFTCKTCTRKYTDGSGSGSGTRAYSCGYYSSKCRAAKGKCEHGRSKSKCKDCGTGYCEHGRASEEPVQRLRHGQPLPAWAGAGRAGARTEARATASTGTRGASARNVERSYCEHGRKKSRRPRAGTAAKA